MRFADALAELDGRVPEHMPKPDLDRIRALAELLDDPQAALNDLFEKMVR